MKEIHICKDGIIIVYRYPGKVRYVTHPFYKPHNGKMVDVLIKKDIDMSSILCKLKKRELEWLRYR